jgi:hypothetical protein
VARSEAENIEEEAETAQNQASFGEDGEDGDGNLMSNVDENTRAIILINATGGIQMANKVSRELHQLCCATAYLPSDSLLLAASDTVP